ncbi:SDR family oxidoreductase [Rossellomorea marisflavi]|uniref:SDR family oxidoreductase n=1 Tax=Rossellomorea marisflavi TaxID=189381 RepID=UPI00296EE54B|nr:SDR family oxidoreductase [Rossellomorea marisflavi]MDW4525464.1 SDR family oxidoreductase [Rossellomorea marisflavi]
MNVLVIGANGQVGKEIIKKLKDTTHVSTALVRKEEQVNELETLGADHVVLGDLEEDFSHAFKGIDSVIFAAGSGGSTGPDKTLLIDLWGAKKAVDYATEVGVKHFVQLSAADSLDVDEESDKMKPYAVAKYMSDYYIEQSGLNYTIVRPGPMNNENATGNIELHQTSRKDHFNDYLITREDVAHVLVNSLGKENLLEKSFYIKQGDSSIENALSTVR